MMTNYYYMYYLTRTR